MKIFGCRLRERYLWHSSTDWTGSQTPAQVDTISLPGVFGVVVRVAACGWVVLLLGLLPGVAADQHITIAGGRARAGPNYLIPPGKQIGGNLFDSFVISFGIVAGRSATFTGRSTVANIIAGVTGANPSRIDGTIRSAIRGASLYFINPNGVVSGRMRRFMSPAAFTPPPPIISNWGATGGSKSPIPTAAS
jgi:filamentous hemagglutinin family protein